MNDKELADSLRDKDYLISKGYKWITCYKCNGLKFIVSKEKEWALPCWVCEGKGGHWKAPLIR